MSAASRGAARENKLKRLLEEDGYVVVRAAGSKGAVDLWAMRPIEKPGMPVGWVRSTEVLAIQVKANVGNAWMNFRREEREELGLIAAKAGATAYLVHWPPHSSPHWYREEDFPKAKVAA